MLYVIIFLIAGAIVASFLYVLKKKATVKDTKGASGGASGHGTGNTANQ